MVAGIHGGGSIMNKNRRSPPLDRGNLNLDDPAATRHWTKKWRVTRSELQRAIDKVGPTVRAVAKELGVPELKQDANA